MFNNTHCHLVPLRHGLGEHLPFREAAPECLAAMTDHEVTQLFVSFPLHCHTHVFECLHVLATVLVQIALDLGQVIDRRHRIHLLLVELKQELDIAVLPPGHHSSPLHPEVHPDEDAPPIVLGSPLLMDESTVGVEAAA